MAVILLITGLCTSAQNSTTPLLNTSFLLKNKLNSSTSRIHFTPPPAAIISWQQVKQIVPADFYACNIGFFCKKELLIEKVIKIPLRFRLGSLQQCNYYEGKKQ